MAQEQKDLIISNLVAKLGPAGIKERVSNETLLEGVKFADQIIDGVKNLTYERVQGIGDDYLPDLYAYNALGTIYPYLTMEQRENAVRAFLGHFDCLRYDRVQYNHTSKIMEPIALTDILSARWLYFSGLEDETKQIGEAKKLKKFESIYMTKDGLFKPNKVDSDFLMAYAALRTDTWDYAKEYAREAHQQFLDRVVKGLVNVFFSDAKTEEKVKEKKKDITRILTPEVYPLIDYHLSKKDWINTKLFP